MIFTDKKNILKNTTDVVAVVAAILALLIVFLAYNSFEPTEEVEKFYKVTETAVYIGAACAFLLSFAVNIASRKLPFVGLAFSLLPLWYLLNCFSLDVLTGENPMAYILFALVHFAGAVIYTVQWTLDSGKEFSRSICCGASSAVLSLIYFGSCALVRFGEKYGEPLFYIRAGFIACAILCSLAGFARCVKTEEGKRKKAALITVCAGSFLSLCALAFELIF